MKKSRLIGIIIAAVFVITVAIVEVTVTNKYLKETENEAQEINQLYSYYGISHYELPQLVDDLFNNWKKRESILCLMSNHKDIEEMGKELSALRSAVEEQNNETFKQSIDLAIYYSRSYRHLFGINIQNLI